MSKNSVNECAENLPRRAVSLNTLNLESESVVLNPLNPDTFLAISSDSDFDCDIKIEKPTIKKMTQSNVSQANTFDLGTAVRVIPEFDGKNDLSQYVRAVELMRGTMVSESDRTQLMQIALLKLKDQAYNYVKYGNYLSWTTLKRDLEKQFGVNKTVSQVSAEIFSLCQKKDEDVDAYSMRCKKLLSEFNELSIRENNWSETDSQAIKAITEMNSKRALDAFVAGLKSPLKTYIKSCRHKELHEAIRDAKEEEAKLQAENLRLNQSGNKSQNNSNSKSPNKNSVVCNYCKKSNHKITECRKRPNYCAHCKKSGHSFSDCRSRHKSRNNQNGSQTSSSSNSGAQEASPSSSGNSNSGNLNSNRATGGTTVQARNLRQ